MSDSDAKRGLPNATVPLSAKTGNQLFEAAVGAIGLDGATVRWLLVSVLKAIGEQPDSLTADDLGVVLPEVDRRLRQLVLGEQADQAMARLYKTLMSWPAGG